MNISVSYKHIIRWVWMVYISMNKWVIIKVSILAMILLWSIGYPSYSMQIRPSDTILVNNIKALLDQQVKSKGSWVLLQYQNIFERVRSRYAQVDRIQYITINSIDHIQNKKSDYDRLCANWSSICEFINVNGRFTISEKIEYVGMTIYLLTTLDRILARPITLQDTVKQLRINNLPDVRGRAWFTTVEINLPSIQSRQEFFEVMTHELCHVIDLSIIQWSSPQIDSRFDHFGNDVFKTDDPSLIFYQISRSGSDIRRPDSRLRNFVSEYAMSDVYEDFAESCNLYLNHNQTFDIMSQQSSTLRSKFLFMKKIFGNQFIWSGNTSINKIKANPSRRPFDTTRI